MKGKGLYPSLMVLIVAFNEEEGIGPTIEELKDRLGPVPIVVVDGYSKDGTAEIAKSMGAKVLYRERKGKGDALKYALSKMEHDYDYIILIDADYTYPAEFLPQMMKTILENPMVGMVSGNRFNSHFHTERMNDIYYLGNRLLALAHNLLNGVKMRDPLTGMRIIRWQILKNWKPRSKGFDIEVEMNYQVERQGYGISEIDISYRSRLGEKKLKAHHGFQILKRMITDTRHSFT
jgi:glycosyltransferase involved in cell wall biosynthesis